MSKQASRVGVRNDQVDIYGRVNTRLPLIDDLASFLPYHTELNVYKDGTEQLLPVNTSEPTTSPVLADIRYPTGIWRNGQYFTYRESPTEATGKARIKSIKGNTLVWNQLVKNARASVTGSGITFTNNSDGTWTLTGIATADVTYGVDASGNRVNVVQGHKYYLRGCPSGGDDAKYYLELQGYARDKGTGVVFTAQSSASDVGVTLTVKNGVDLGSGITFAPQLFDLTLNETNDLDTFISLFPLQKYAYGQYLLNFNGSGIKTTGFNQWDEEWEIGSINNATGISQNAGTNRIRSKNYIPCLPNTSYCLYNGSNVQSYAYFYDGSQNYLGMSSTNAVNPRVFTTPSNCVYMKIRTNDNTSSTYQNNICLNISDPSKNGTYESYISSITSLPISTYFPTGMKSAGTSKVCDELSDRAITRVGAIQLTGDLEWHRTTPAYNFWIPLDSLVRSNNYSLIMTCNTLQPLSTGASDSTTSDYPRWVAGYPKNSTYPNQNYLYIHIDGITTVGELETWLTNNPTTLNYELATYMEESTLDLE